MLVWSSTAARFQHVAGMLLPLNAPRIPLPPAPAQATLPLPQYGQRLLALYAGVLLLLGGPIAAQTFEPLEQVRRFGGFANEKKACTLEQRVDLRREFISSHVEGGCSELLRDAMQCSDV